MNTEKTMQNRMTLRVAAGSLAFALPKDTDRTQVDFYKYASKNGISVAAQLRDAFKTVDLLKNTTTDRAKVMVDSPVLLIPLDEYNDNDKETLYKHSFPSTEGCAIIGNVLPDLNAVAVFALNRDLKLVVEDHYSDTRYIHLMQPVWDYLHRRHFLGNRRKLYVYFHDNELEMFSFERNHFIFYNRYQARSAKDAVYFTLFVWKQLALDQMHDELFLGGEIPDKEQLLRGLRSYVQMVAVISSAASFSNVPLTQEKGITFDMITSLLA